MTDQPEPAEPEQHRPDDTKPPTVEDFLNAVETALGHWLLPNVALFDDARSAVMRGIVPLIDQLRAQPPAAPDDGLRERYAAAAEEAHLEWMRPGSDAGQRPLADYLADALAAVRDRRMEQLAAGRATWRRKALEMEADRDQLAAELAAERRRAEQAEADVNHNAALSHDFRQRAEQAEAAIARVRSLTGRWAKRTDQLKRAAELLEAALDEPGAPGA